MNTNLVNKQTLAPRAEKARSASLFAGVIQKSDKVHNVVLPGSNGKSYDIILKKIMVSNQPVLQAECRLNVRIGHQDCKGALVSVCYHTLAAVVAMATKAGMEVSFCHSRKDAINVANLHHGKKFKVRSKQSGKEVWVVAY